MNQNRPLLIMVFAAITVLWISYQSLGGFAGIQRDPAVSFGVLVLMALVAVPVFWFRYRRLRREPIYVEVANPGPNAPLDRRLDHTPLVIGASPSKVLVLLLSAMLGCAYIAWLMWAQPGICRTIGLASTALLLLPGAALSIVGLIVQERLEITPHGLTHTTFWSSHHWSWDEVRNINVIKPRAFGAAWSSGIFFNRFAIDANTSGSPRPTFRPIWSMKTDDVAELLNAARLRWSSPAGAKFVPVRKTAAYYLRTAYVWLFAAVMLVLIIGHPCGT